MKFIKFIMSQKGLEFTVSEETAEEILTSPQQLVPVKDLNGNWTGETINKAHIIATERDRFEEKDWWQKNTQKLEEPKKKTKEDKEKIRRWTDTISKERPWLTDKLSMKKYGNKRS